MGVWKCAVLPADALSRTDEGLCQTITALSTSAFQSNCTTSCPSSNVWRFQLCPIFKKPTGSLCPPASTRLTHSWQLPSHRTELSPNITLTMRVLPSPLSKELKMHCFGSDKTPCSHHFKSTLLYKANKAMCLRVSPLTPTLRRTGEALAQVDCPEDVPSACMSDLSSDAVFSQHGAEQNPNLKRPVSKEDFPKEMTVIVGGRLWDFSLSGLTGIYMNLAIVKFSASKVLEDIL